MNNKILAAVSVIALLGSMPAFAQTDKPQRQINAEESTTGNIAEDAKTAWKDMKGDMSDSYEDIKGVLISDNDTDKNMPVTIDSRKTAVGIIGHRVYNEKQENVAKVTDIILDHNGQAKMVVVTETNFMGLDIGKFAAFDYTDITRVEADGDVIMPLTEKIIDNAAYFSYNQADAGDKTRVIPNDGYSVSRLLKGRLLNEKRESVADIENISFKNGHANQIIVGFDKTLGFGGEMVVLSYNDAAIVRNGDALDFQLNSKKSAQFETYKNRANN